MVVVTRGIYWERSCPLDFIQISLAVAVGHGAVWSTCGLYWDTRQRSAKCRRTDFTAEGKGICTINLTSPAISASAAERLSYLVCAHVEALMETFYGRYKLALLVPAAAMDRESDQMYSRLLLLLRPDTLRVLVLVSV